MTHLHFLKLSSEHLKFGVLDLLGSFAGGLKNGPRLFSGLHIRYPVEFISRNTTKNSINSFALSICQSKCSLIPFDFRCCRSHPTILNGIPNGLIDNT